MLPNVKLLRKEFGISQKRLADAVEVSQQSINQYENHSIEPDIAVLSRLADYFDTSIDFIVGRTNIRLATESHLDENLKRDEMILIEKYRQLTAEQKRSLSMLMDALLVITEGKTERQKETRAL